VGCEAAALLIFFYLFAFWGGWVGLSGKGAGGRDKGGGGRGGGGKFYGLCYFGGWYLCRADI
jgi:hypothetical protein